jgi:hypothetical protein
MFKETNKHITLLHIPFSHPTNQGHIMAVVFLSLSSSSSSSIFWDRRQPAYCTSAFEAVCTLTHILLPPFISRGVPRQTV